MRQVLHKWEAVSLTQARLVVFLDMDIEVLPHHFGPIAPRGAAAARARDASDVVARSWKRLLTCAADGDGGRLNLLSYPDFSSPVNAALLLIRPSRSLYEEGLGVLRGGARLPFNVSSGWARVGRPSEVLPRSDDAWRRRRGHMQMLDTDQWDFVGASIDQGFFFYMMRVRHALGGDIRLSRCATNPADDRTSIFHYGAEGGVKPWDQLARVGCPAAHETWLPNAITRDLMMRRNGRALALEAARVISWGSRSVRALRELRASVRAQALLRGEGRGGGAGGGAVGGDAFSLSKTLTVSISYIEEQLRCFEVGLRRFNVSGGGGSVYEYVLARAPSRDLTKYVCREIPLSASASSATYTAQPEWERPKAFANVPPTPRRLRHGAKGLRGGGGG